MAVNNIPGSGPITNATKQVVSGSPAGDSVVSSPLSGLQDSLAKGNVSDSKANLEQLGKTLSRYHSSEMSFSKDLQRMEEREIQQLTLKVKLSQSEIKAFQQDLSLMYKKNDVDKKAVDLIKNKIALERDNQRVAREDIRSAQEKIRLGSMYRRDQKMAFDEFREQSRRTASELHKVEEARKRSYGAHLFKNGFNPMQAAQTYGRQKMAANLPSALGGEEGASLSGFGGGAVAALGGALLSKLVGLVKDDTMRMLHASYGIADVYKGSGAGETGVGSADFRSGIIDSIREMGTSLEENVAMLKSVRPIMGAMSGGNFGELIRQGVSSDRAFGSDLGTGATFLANMVRKGDTSGDTGSLNKLSTAFAEALGRGKLIGLQEELVGGVTQLVEITRRSSASGATSGGMFAGMIADISSIGNKSLKGMDAANIIAGLDNGLKSPGNAFAGVVGAGSIRTVLSKLVDQGLVDQSALSTSNILTLQAQGMGAQAKGKNGQMINLAPMLLPEMLNQGVALGGNGQLSTLAMAHSFGIPIGQMQAMMANRSFLNSDQGSKFNAAFGIGAAGVDSSAGVNTFISQLAKRFQDLSSLAGGRDLSEREKRAILGETVERYKLSVPDNQADAMGKLFNDTSKLSVEEQTKKLLEMAKESNVGAPEDAVKSAIMDIRNLTLALTDTIVKELPGISNKLDKMLPGAKDNRLVQGGSGPVAAPTDADGYSTRGYKGNGISGSASTITPGEATSGDYYTDIKNKINAMKIADAKRTEMAGSDALKQGILAAAAKNNVDPVQLMKLSQIESGGNLNAIGYKRTRDNKGYELDANGNKIPVAFGPFQFTKATGAGYGLTKDEDFTDPAKSSEAAAELWSHLMKKYGGDVEKAVAEYNGGPGANIPGHRMAETDAEIENARRVGLVPTAAETAPNVLQTQGQQAAATQRVGVDQNVTLTLQNNSGQTVQQGSQSYNHQITLGQSTPSTSYKRAVTIGPSLP